VTPNLQHPVLPVNVLSSLLLLAALTMSLWYWSRGKRLNSEKLTIAFGGVVGAIFGAKTGYFLAEVPIWWGDPLFWLRMLAGKTILGGLLGGWLGVVAAKRAVGEKQIMGDEFARILPLGIGIGRVSCMIHGCCSGRAVADVLPEFMASRMQQIGFEFWPAALVEIGFQATFWLTCLAIRNVSWLKGQQFHLYLISYGLFRAIHEHFRSTVRYAGTEVSPYMILGLVIAGAGAVAFVSRRRTVRPQN